ncbi:MAG: hypothetical protein WC935_01695 [Thermoleophilia bacterium]
MTGKQATNSWVKRLMDADETSLSGFTVDAVDGIAGRIEQVLYWSDARVPDYVVVGTGRWIFGHKSVLSIKVIEEVDLENRRLRMSLSKEQIRQAPEFLPGI